MPYLRHVLERIPGLLGLILVLTAALLPGVHALSHAHVGVESDSCSGLHGHCGHTRDDAGDTGQDGDAEGASSSGLAAPCSICQTLAATRHLAPIDDTAATVAHGFDHAIVHGLRVDALLAQGCPHAAQARAPPLVS